MGHRSNKEFAEKVAGLERPRNHWPRWVVSGGGLGLLRPAPGSWGTLGPAAIYWVLLMCGMGDPWRSVLCLAGAVVTGFLLVKLGPWACAYYQQPDPGQVVLDEYSGFWVTAAFVPVPAWAHGAWLTWCFTAGLYVLFRLTDTLKIPPARQLERLPWGWGILLDDIAAGIQANVVAQIVVRLLWI